MHTATRTLMIVMVLLTVMPVGAGVPPAQPPTKEECEAQDLPTSYCFQLRCRDLSEPTPECLRLQQRVREERLKRPEPHAPTAPTPPRGTS
jgi:hypothetical protein